MNTMIGYREVQEAGSKGKALQSLMLLVRNFLCQTDLGIQSRHARYALEQEAHVPTRVWKRHSALLSLLVELDGSDGARKNLSD